MVATVEENAKYCVTVGLVTRTGGIFTKLLKVLAVQRARFARMWII